MRHAVDGLAELHLLDEQAGHDGLAGAGVVGEQEPQARLRQHLEVDRLDLVRQGADAGEADGELAVVGVGKADAGGLHQEPELLPIGRVDPCRSGRLLVQNPLKIVGGSDRFIEFATGEANADLPRRRRVAALPRWSPHSRSAPALTARRPTSASKRSASLGHAGQIAPFDPLYRVCGQRPCGAPLPDLPDGSLRCDQIRQAARKPEARHGNHRKGPLGPLDHWGRWLRKWAVSRIRNFATNVPLVHGDIGTAPALRRAG